MKIVITGGHHISALALANELRNHKHEVFWLGCRYPRWPEKTEGIEYKQVNQSNITFFDIKAGKFYKNFFRWWRIPIGFLQSLRVLVKIKPDLIVSFGGYIAVPVVISGWFLKIPSLSHEQTRVAGMANKFLANFCKAIFLSFPESERFFPSKKVLFVGLPLRKELLLQKQKINFNNHLRTIIFLGGGQGSHTINNELEKMLMKLLTKFNVIHQTGNILNNSDYRKFLMIRKNLSCEIQKRYLLKDFFSNSELAKAIKTADFAVCRSGAHTTYELGVLGKPAIFVPLAFSFANEQLINAQFFVKFKAGEIVQQKNIRNLAEIIDKMNRNLAFYQKNAQKMSSLFPVDATKAIIEYIENYDKKKAVQVSSSLA